MINVNSLPSYSVRKRLVKSGMVGWLGETYLNDWTSHRKVYDIITFFALILIK